MLADRLTVERAVRRERDRQDSMWGTSFPDRPWDRWLTILTEEVGEVAEAILEGDVDDIREELTQVAAVAMSALQYGGQ